MTGNHIDPIEELAGILREAMLDQRITEAELERLVHREVERTTITRIINANPDTNWTAVRTIAHELRCDIARLERLSAAAGRTVGPTPTFGRRLRDRRKELGLSQRRIAVRMGVSKTAYLQYEHDKSLPEAGRLPALAHALRIPTSRLGRWLHDSPLRRVGPTRH